jgi:hypothetical protein
MEFFKDSSPAENTVITTAHAQEKAGVMSKTVGQPINRISTRQPNAKKTAHRFLIAQGALNLFEGMEGNLSIDMKKPQNITAGDSGARVHLRSAIRAGLDELITKTGGKLFGAIGAHPINHDYLRFGRVRAKVP